MRVLLSLTPCCLNLSNGSNAKIAFIMCRLNIGCCRDIFYMFKCLYECGIHSGILGVYDFEKVFLHGGLTPSLAGIFTMIARKESDSTVGNGSMSSTIYLDIIFVLIQSD